MKRLIHQTKNKLRQVRHARVRARVVGTAALPRLSVFRSLKGINAQLIDDATGRTLVAATLKDVKKTDEAEGMKGKVAQAYLIGKALAQKAQAKNITAAVFDRGGYRYHGRVQALADGARAGGLKF